MESHFCVLSILLYSFECFKINSIYILIRENKNGCNKVLFWSL